MGNVTVPIWKPTPTKRESQILETIDYNPISFNNPSHSVDLKEHTDEPYVKPISRNLPSDDAFVMRSQSGYQVTNDGSQPAINVPVS